MIYNSTGCTMSSELIYIKWLWGVMNAILEYTRSYTDWTAETAEA
jgi:hypothetical protein